MTAETASVECLICHRVLPRREMRDSGNLSPGVAALLAAERPDWHGEGAVCRDDLARLRRLHFEKLLADEQGALSAVDREVIASLESGAPLAEDVEASFAERRSFGERAADIVASFGGSWTFILVFLLVLVLWIAWNVIGLLGKTFDPYPFILLNLLLSCIAAIQAPIIMMSQRRTEAKDRLRAINDYKVNLKAELEIRHLYDKIDNQLARQWDRLVEMQRIQIEMLEEAADDSQSARAATTPEPGKAPG